MRIQGSGWNKKVSASGIAIESVKKSGKKAVTISWDTVKNVDSYTVYRSTSRKGTFKKIGTATGSSFTDKAVTKGKTYYYKVVPVTKYEKASITLAASPVKNIKFR